MSRVPQLGQAYSTLESPATPSPKTTALPFAASVIAVALVLLSSARYGLIATPDSAAYFSVARNLAEGRGFIRYDEEPFVHWPPLYPAVLAALHSVGLGVAAAARWLNALLFGVIALMMGRHFHKSVNDRVVAILATLLVVCSMPLLRVFSFALSEGLFITLVTAASLRLESGLCKRGRPKDAASSVPPLTLATGLTALASLTRFVGVALVIAGGAIMLGPPRRWSRARLVSAILFVGCSAVSLLLWLGRSYVVSGTWTGERSGAARPLSQTLWEFADELSLWFIPPMVGAPIRVGICLIAFTAIGVTMARRRVRPQAPAGTQRPDVFLWFAVCYVILVNTMSAVAYFDEWSNRLLAPCYIPFVAMIVRGANSSTRSPRSRRIIRVLMAFWLLYQAAGSAVTIHRYGRHSAGLADTTWRGSELAAMLRTDPPPGPLYSNWPAHTYWLTGLGVKHVPRTNHSLTLETWSSELSATLEQGTPVTLIWWNRDGPFRYTLDEVKRYLVLEPIESRSDGTAFRVVGLR